MVGVIIMGARSELHLFIIWENARYKENKIIEDINHKLKILNIYEIKWSPGNFAKNLSRFYGTKLPDGSFKEKHCGRGPFLLIIVEDTNPKYRKRNTSRGTEIVNINMFDAKSTYRDWTGGGHKIHATNSIQETNHDLTLLLGKNAEDYKKDYNTEWNGEITKLQEDIIGANGWDNIQQLFYVLNNTVNYVVLRNFECLPEQYNMKNHGDIDLLTDNYYDLCWITNAKKVFKPKYRVHYKVNIGGEEVYFDFRYLGDNYYDINWQKKILSNKVLMKNCFYAPDYVNYFYSLLYHVIVHKKTVADDYAERLWLMSQQILNKEYDYTYFKNINFLKSILDSFMIKNNYQYKEPVDRSVYFNNNLIKIRISLGRKLQEKLIIPIKRRLKPVKQLIIKD
ncbi:hypothetical protein J2S00_002241 [Caldalkalibacillus uzonensis]|uniref:Uncharacterized protein n=1 Tax=Caldalkalibacillus uzonensis TaxID=353224 RepID=A0ABU0CU82_9BACI|nr:hypothetical protein [Caldalkalibacillus uzonensis]MDQ0339454.1 hypothetical protein [Caldalkalibacillus uzonensis]